VAGVMLQGTRWLRVRRFPVGSDRYLGGEVNQAGEFSLPRREEHVGQTRLSHSQLPRVTMLGSSFRAWTEARRLRHTQAFTDTRISRIKPPVLSQLPLFGPVTINITRRPPDRDAPAPAPPTAVSSSLRSLHRCRSRGSAGPP